jgi:hypothetical protein
VAECPAAAVWAECTKSLHRAIYPSARQCRAEGSDSQRASGVTHRDALSFWVVFGGNGMGKPDRP